MNQKIHNFDTYIKHKEIRFSLRYFVHFGKQEISLYYR